MEELLLRLHLQTMKIPLHETLHETCVTLTQKEMVKFCLESESKMGTIKII